MVKPKAKWQDLLTVGGIFCGYAAMNAEDTLFLGIYSLLGCAFFVGAIRSHEELGKAARAALYILAIGTTLYLSYRTYEKNLTRELHEKDGALIPANLPMPLSNCPIPQDAFAIYVGGNVSWTRTFPNTVFRSQGYDLVTLDRDPDGGILVTANIFDDRMNLVAGISKDKFVTSSYASHFERPDRSTYIVYDHLGAMVFKIQFINDRAIEIPKAQIRAPGGRGILVEPKFVTERGNIIAGSCTGNGVVPFVF